MGAFLGLPITGGVHLVGDLTTLRTCPRAALNWGYNSRLGDTSPILSISPSRLGFINQIGSGPSTVRGPGV